VQADIDRASVDIDRASVDIDRASVDIDHVSVDIDRVSRAIVCLRRSAERFLYHQDTKSQSGIFSVNRRGFA
jgi:hypothetical protein